MKQYIDKEKVEDNLRNLWKEDDGSNPEHSICYNKAIQEVQMKIDKLTNLMLMKYLTSLMDQLKMR